MYNHQGGYPPPLQQQAPPASYGSPRQQGLQGAPGAYGAPHTHAGVPQQHQQTQQALLVEGRSVDLVQHVLIEREARHDDDGPGQAVIVEDLFELHLQLSLEAVERFEFLG